MITTILVIHSKHVPTRNELETVSRAAFDAAGEQGFEPLRMRAISGLETDADVRLEDRERIAKWERRS
jgi:hypothetical protein